MKKKLCTLLLAAILAAGLTVPAGAYTFIQGNGGSYYRSQEMYELFQAREDEFIKKYGIYPDLQQEYHDGLLWLNEKGLFLTEDGEVVDLNQGRFAQVYPFSDGMAAVVLTNPGYAGYYGYIDTKGTLMLPAPRFNSFSISCDKYPNVHGGVGRFVNGKALVVGEYQQYGDEPMHFDSLRVWWYYFALTEHEKQNNELPTGLDYAYIDKTGRMITDVQKVYTEEDALRLLADTLYDPHGNTVQEQMEDKKFIKPDPEVPYRIYEGPEDGKAEQPAIPQPVEATYGKASVTAKGYTIENNIGYFLIDVKNDADAPDKGDLFYVLYYKFKEAKGVISNNTDFLPDDYIRQIRYTVEPHSVTTLRVPVGMLGNWEGELTDENKAAGWYTQTNVADSRYVLAQAETEEERDALEECLKAAHFYGDAWTPDYAWKGDIRTLAEPAPVRGIKERLDTLLGGLTSQF